MRLIKSQSIALDHNVSYLSVSKLGVHMFPADFCRVWITLECTRVVSHTRNRFDTYILIAGGRQQTYRLARGHY
jgi:hypothetical protein